MTTLRPALMASGSQQILCLPWVVFFVVVVALFVCLSVCWFFFLPSFAFPAGTMAADAPACWVPSLLSLEGSQLLPAAAGQCEKERSITTPDTAGTGGTIIQKGHFCALSKEERTPSWALHPHDPA